MMVTNWKLHVEIFFDIRYFIEKQEHFQVLLNFRLPLEKIKNFLTNSWVLPRGSEDFITRVILSENGRD